MKKAFGKIAIICILIALVGFSLNLLFDEQIVTYITRTDVNGTIYYKYDFYSYVRGIVNTLDSTPELQLTTPTRAWIYQASDITQVGTMIGNDLAVIVDWMIFGLNIIIYPFRIIFYAIKVILTVIGLDMTDQYTTALAWLKIVTNTFISFQVPYI